MSRKPVEKESDIQRAICDYLTLKRWLWWRNNSGHVKVTGGYMKLGIAGSPDLYVLRHGKLWGIEVKSAKTCQSRIQSEFQRTLEINGGRYCLARSVQDVIDGIK